MSDTVVPSIQPALLSVANRPVATVVIPPGIPANDPAKPAWALTQEQIDFLVNLVAGYWPAVKQYWPIILLILSSLGVGSFFTGRLTAPVVPPMVVPAPVVPPLSPFAPPISPVVVPVNKLALIVYVTAATDAKVLAELKTLPVAVTVDGPHAAGSTYPFGTKSVLLPCVVLVRADGTVVDVQSFRSAADVAGLLAKWAGK